MMERSHKDCLSKDHGHKTTAHARANHPGSSRARHPVDIDDTTGSSLLLTLAFNLVIPVAQVIGGSYANSMAVISDAIHNFSDFTAVLIAYFAYRIGKRGASVRSTFGYRRAEILAALINVVILVLAAIFIVYEALGRLRHPGAVSGQIVMWMAGIGILGNGLSTWLLHRDAKHSLNVRGAFLHMLGDLLTSVVVLVNGAILIFKPWYWLDPLLSLLIVLFILKNCWSILKEAGVILMNATPKSLDIRAIKASLEQIPGVCGVHYLHAWNVSSSSIAFSCHVVVSDQLLSQTETLSSTIRHDLFHRFGIDHAVLQFETAECGNGSLLCEMSSCVGTEQTSLPSEKVEKKRKWSEGKFLVPALRVFLGSVFVYASVDKIIDPAAFAEAIYNYRILPDAFINFTSIILPWLELLLGVCLIFGIWLHGSLFLGNLLLITFFGSLLFNVIRGLDIHCGCFSTTAQDLEGNSVMRPRRCLLLASMKYASLEAITSIRNVC